jgi:hypothetical protein
MACRSAAARFANGADSVVTRLRESLCADSHRRFHHHRCRHGIVNVIPPHAEKLSRSRWNRDHVRLEFAFTMRWKS